MTCNLSQMLQWAFLPHDAIYVSTKKLENLFPIVCFWNKSCWMGAVLEKPNIKFRLCSFKGNSILVEAAKVAANFKHLFFRKMATVRNCASNLITRKKRVVACLLLLPEKAVQNPFPHIFMWNDMFWCDTTKKKACCLFFEKKELLAPLFFTSVWLQSSKSAH